jgi:AraC-like DNA-binding protein
MECSFAGRKLATPGDVLLHGAFDCHANVPAGTRPIQILRLPWNDDTVEGHFRVRDPDGLVRLAEGNPLEAMTALARELLAMTPQDRHWTNALARALAAGSPQSLRQWGEERGLRPAELSHGFRSAFGVSPKLFRLEARSRRAWGIIIRSNSSLTRIAQDLNFSDLAHMSRSIHTFTGHSPRSWRGCSRHQCQSRIEPVPVASLSPRPSESDLVKTRRSVQRLESTASSDTKI